MGGSFACRCPPGFMLENNPFDVRNTTIATIETLYNTPTTILDNTYTNRETDQDHTALLVAKTGAGLACIDIDECNMSDGVAKCGTNAKCINFPGSYRCLCPSGFQGQGYLHCES